MRTVRNAFVLCAAVLVTGCAGGGASVARRAAPATSPPPASATATLTVVVNLPSPTSPSGARLAKYVSTATSGLTVWYVPDGQPIRSGGGTSGTCTATTCTATVNAPVGRVDIEVDLTNSYSQPLSVAETVATIAPGTANTVNVVFDGSPASIVLTPVSGNPAAFTKGLAGTMAFKTTVLDVYGRVISGQARLTNPVLLQTNETTGAVSVTPSQIDGGVIATTSSGTPPNVVTVAYDGTPPSTSSITLTAQVGLGQWAVSVSAPSIAISGAAPAFSGVNALGVNVATQQNGNTWLGYVPAGATIANGVAASLLMPQSSLDTLFDRVTLQLGNSAQPFAARRTIRDVKPARTVRSTLWDAPRRADIATMRRAGRPLTAEHVAPYAVRRSRSLTIGTRQSFWVDKFDITSPTVKYVNTPYVLAALTQHGAIWIDATPGTQTSQTQAAAVSQLASDFETAWTLVSTYFGSASYAGSAPAGGFVAVTCDANGTHQNAYDNFPVPDPGYMNVLITDQSELGAGVGGYNSPADFFPQNIANCIRVKSNAAPTITIGYSGSGSAIQPIVHEYAEVAAFVQHAITRGGSAEGNNVLDGLAMIAQDLATGQPESNNVALASVYLSAPENYSLTAFAGYENGNLSDNCQGCYGEAYLFFRYLVDRFGTGILAKITQSGETSMANVSAATGVGPQQLIKDFATMLAVSGTGITSSTDRVTNMQSLPLRGAYTDETGRHWTAQELTPHPEVTVTSSSQLLQSWAGAFIFFTVPPPGSNGSAVKATDVYSDRSLWLGLATK
jgi:hypothetical protein